MFTSWGRVAKARHDVFALRDRGQCLPAYEGSLLARGNGRSYGDSNLNPEAGLLLTRRLDKFIAFDPTTGLLRCEAGVLLEEIIELVLPQGWFLSVTPGTQLVTVGGAIANDVHGKNHHVAGTFGHHVRGFELLRSDGSRRWCSEEENTALYTATIGGLGLTGLITLAEIQLRRVANSALNTETVKFRNLGDFFELNQSSERDYEYTVSWIDCTSTGKQLGRGLFSRANHAPALSNTAHIPSDLLALSSRSSIRIPVTPPISLVNNLSLKAFNALYYYNQRPQTIRKLEHYKSFFYPLDSVLEWNRIYGLQGFYQYQCVVPTARAHATTSALLDAVARSGLGSFLAVLKQFGGRSAQGMLSFPMRGTTLALDFPNTGVKVHRLFEALDRIVLEAGGRLYIAKDGRMSSAMFKAGYSRLQEFIPHVDPHFSSGWWRRVMETS